MYCKLFTSLYQGTLRGKPHEILVFTNLLAHCDREGYVDIHFRAIAEEVGLTEDEVKAAIKKLEAPDPESRTPDMDGKRLVPMDSHRAWGWRVVNYVKYRGIRNEEERRLQSVEAQRRFREKSTSKPPSASVSQGKPPSAHAEVEVEAAKTPNPVATAPVGGGDSPAERVYAIYPRHEGKKAAIKAITAALKTQPLEKILERTTTYAKAIELWPEQDKRYVPHPATWFNQGRYDDDPLTWNRNGRAAIQAASPLAKKF